MDDDLMNELATSFDNVSVQTHLYAEAERRRLQSRKDEELAQELAARFEREDKWDSLARRHPNFDAEILRNLFEAFDGNVEEIEKEISAQSVQRSRSPRGAPSPPLRVVTVPEAEDGSGLLITECRHTFPELSSSLERPQKKAHAVRKSSSMPTMTSKPSYASLAAAVVPADQDNWYRLMNQFPHMDPEALRQIFMDHGRNLQDTVRFIQDAARQKRAEPVPEPEPKKDEKRSKYRNIDADAARAESNYHLQQSQYFADLLAKDPNLKKHYPDLAQYYKTMAEAHVYQHEEEKDKAAALIAKAMNSDKDPFTLDLHYLFGYEAVEHLSGWLAMQTADLGAGDSGRRHRFLKVITGKGLHSRRGQPRLFGLVKKYLKDNDYTFQEMDGHFWVKITA